MEGNKFQSILYKMIYLILS